MPLVKAKCTSCGASLEVDPLNEVASCPYCGTPYTVEKAINNYNFTNNIQAQTVNIYGAINSDFEIRAGELFRYKGASVNVNIPDGVKKIKNRAFESSLVERVFIPDTTVKIEFGAFIFCEDLKEITLPNSIVFIGHNAFQDCSALTEITIPSSVRKIERNAFSRCTNLRSVNIQNGLKVIDINTFLGCKNLVNVSIPESVETICDGAFKGCVNLKNLRLSEGLKTIGCDAFKDCAFTSIALPLSVEKINRPFSNKLEQIKMSPKLVDNCLHINTGVNGSAWTEFPPIVEKKIYGDMETILKNARKREGKCVYCGHNEFTFFNKCKKCGRKKDY